MAISETNVRYVKTWKPNYISDSYWSTATASLIMTSLMTS